MLDKLAKSHDKWISYAITLTKCRDKAHDLVQDMYIKIHLSEKEINDFYVKRIIKNIFIDEKRRNREFNTIDEFGIDFEIESNSQDEEEIKDRQDSIGSFYSNLPKYDEVIFRECYTIGQRKFSRESEIPLNWIQYKIRTFKNKICQEQKNPQKRNPQAWETLSLKLQQQ